MIHQSVNDFYTRFLLKIVALPQEVEFLLDISATFFNDFSPDVRYLLIAEGVQVPQRLPKKKPPRKPEASPGKKRSGGSR